MNTRGHSGALEYRQRAAVELYRQEAERARQTAKQAAGARDRAFWVALAANWEKLAKAAEAPKIRPWATSAYAPPLPAALVGGKEGATRNA